MKEIQFFVSEQIHLPVREILGDCFYVKMTNPSPHKIANSPHKIAKQEEMEMNRSREEIKVNKKKEEVEEEEEKEECDVIWEAVNFALAQLNLDSSKESAGTANGEEMEEEL